MTGITNRPPPQSRTGLPLFGPPASDSGPDRQRVRSGRPAHHRFTGRPARRIPKDRSLVSAERQVQASRENRP